MVDYGEELDAGVGTRCADDFADRGAGKRIAGGGTATPYGRLESARFAWGIGGAPAVGGYEILTP